MLVKCHIMFLSSYFEPRATSDCFPFLLQPTPNAHLQHSSPSSRPVRSCMCLCEHLRALGFVPSWILYRFHTNMERNNPIMINIILRFSIKWLIMCKKKDLELASNLKRKGKFSHIFSNAYRT